MATRRCLVVGSTGYVGTVICEKLIQAGWAVLGTARTAAKAELLRATGVEPVLTPEGILDPAVAATASSCDAVIDVMRGSFKTRTKAAQIIIEALCGRGGTFVATTGTNFYGHTGFRAVAHEDWPYNPEPMTFSSWAPAQQQTQHTIDTWWQRFERSVLRGATVGANTVIVRPSYVYGRRPGAQVSAAKERKAAVYVGDGSQRIGTVHVDDLADLYVLIVQGQHKYPPGSCFIGCSGLATRSKLAEAVALVAGCRCASWSLKRAQDAVGIVKTESLARENATSGAKACCVLGWSPNRLGMVDDLLSKL